MYYLNNDLKIIHRDLKAANIFLVENGKRIDIKIGDFGHSLNKLKPHMKKYFNMGTLAWLVRNLNNNNSLFSSIIL
jgi:serine/threonine protein kinase